MPIYVLISIWNSTLTSLSKGFVEVLNQIAMSWETRSTRVITSLVGLLLIGSVESLSPVRPVSSSSSSSSSTGNDALPTSLDSTEENNHHKRVYRLVFLATMAMMAAALGARFCAVAYNWGRRQPQVSTNTRSSSSNSDNKIVQGYQYQYAGAGDRTYSPVADRENYIGSSNNSNSNSNSGGGGYQQDFRGADGFPITDEIDPLNGRLTAFGYGNRQPALVV